jgi:hypothetical protein
MDGVVVWLLIAACFVQAGCQIARGITLLLGMPELDAWIKGENCD